MNAINHNSATADHVPVGTQLKRAREERQLTISQIAEAQHLRPTVISYIEACEYRKVGSELFVKGYVRAYAEQVGLSSSKLSQELDRELEPWRAQQQAAQDSSPLAGIAKRKEHKKRVARKVFAVLGGLAALAIVGIVVKSSLDREHLPVATPEDFRAVERPADDAVAPETTAGESVSADTGGGTVTPDTSGAEFSRQSGEPTFESSPSASESVASVPASTADSPELSDNQASSAELATSEADVNTGAADMDSGQGTLSESRPPAAESAEVGSSDDASMAASSAPSTSEQTSQPNRSASSSDASSSAAETASVPPVAPGDYVEFSAEFTGDCWVEIRDFAGDILRAQLYNAGDRLSVSGTGPLRIVFGAVSVVDNATVDGQPLDLDGFRAYRDRVNFSIGG